jgi:hypothetical protein
MKRTNYLTKIFYFRLENFENNDYDDDAKLANFEQKKTTTMIYLFRNQKLDNNNNNNNT